MISKDDVKYVAGLSRIHLKDDETEHLTKDLEAILGYINKISNLDLKDVKPTSHALPIANVFREDTVKPSLSQDEATKFAISMHEGAFKVPKVIE